MKPLALQDIADATEGALHCVSPNVTVRAVSTDSRRVQAGDLFVCLPGERVDGHDFAAAAVAGGARCAHIAANAGCDPADRLS